MLYSTDYPNKVCLETRVAPCCPTEDCDDLQLVSSAQVSVAGEDVTVKYYISQDGKWWLLYTNGCCMFNFAHAFYHDL